MESANLSKSKVIKVRQIVYVRVFGSKLKIEAYNKRVNEESRSVAK